MSGIQEHTVSNVYVQIEVYSLSISLGLIHTNYG